MHDDCPCHLTAVIMSIYRWQLLYCYRKKVPSTRCHHAGGVINQRGAQLTYHVQLTQLTSHVHSNMGTTYHVHTNMDTTYHVHPATCCQDLLLHVLHRNTGLISHQEGEIWCGRPRCPSIRRQCIAYMWPFPRQRARLLRSRLHRWQASITWNHSVRFLSFTSFLSDYVHQLQLGLPC